MCGRPGRTRIIFNHKFFVSNAESKRKNRFSLPIFFKWTLYYFSLPAAGVSSTALSGLRIGWHYSYFLPSLCALLLSSLFPSPSHSSCFFPSSHLPLLISSTPLHPGSPVISSGLRHPRQLCWAFVLLHSRRVIPQCVPLPHFSFHARNFTYRAFLPTFFFSPLEVGKGTLIC